MIETPRLVFVTAHERYAVEALEVDARNAAVRARLCCLLQRATR